MYDDNIYKSLYKSENINTNNIAKIFNKTYVSYPYKIIDKA